jgi:hypothetical protein
MAIEPNRNSISIWRKSRASGADQGCVEVAKFGSSVQVRDSRAPSGVILEFSPAQWQGFVLRVKEGNAAAASGLSR